MNEFDTLPANGTAPELPRSRTELPARKAKARKQSTARAPRAPKHRRAEQDACKWAHRYATGAVLVSAALNGFQATQDTQLTGMIGLPAAAILGALVPLAVWTLARVASSLARAAWRREAIVIGLIGVCVLALSVIHCSRALDTITGCGLVLSYCLAIGIDVGLVGCEAVATMLKAQD